jgi:hypothetical protein
MTATYYVTATLFRGWRRQPGNHLRSGLVFVTAELRLLITVAARSKAWTVFARSNTGIVGSNPTRGMDVCVCLFCLFCPVCAGSSLAMRWSPSKESYWLCKKIKKLKKRSRSNKGLQSHRQTDRQIDRIMFNSPIVGRRVEGLNFG